MRFVLFHIACVMFTLIVAPGSSPGQERLANHLHVFLVADTNADIGPFCAKDRDQLTGVLKEVFENQESPFPNRYTLKVLDDEDVTPQTILKKIAETEVGPDDAILFYYSGHGASDGKLGHFLATSGGRLLRTELRKVLLDKRPRMLAIVTDSCSSRAEFTPPDRQTPAKWRVFHDLFFAQTGLADFQSSQDGVVSWCGTFTNALTANLCVPPDTLDDNKDAFVDWQEYFSAVRRDTLKNFHRARQAHSPSSKIHQVAPQTPYAFNLPVKASPSALVLPLPGAKPESTFTDLAASADGTKLLSGDSEGRIRLWDPVTGRPVRVFEQPSQWVWELSISADGRHALSNDLFHTHGEDFKAENVNRVWDVENGKSLRRIPRSRFGWGTQFLDADHAVLADLERTGDLTLWNWHTDESAGVFSIRNKDLAARSVTPQPQQRLRLVDGDPVTGKCWVQTIAAGNERESFLEFPMPIRPFKATVSPDGRLVALAWTADVDDRGQMKSGRLLWKVEVWSCDGAKLERVKVLQKLRGDYPSLVFSPDSRFLAVSIKEGPTDSKEMPWDNYALTSALEVWNLCTNRLVLRAGDLPPQNSHRIPRGVAFVNQAQAVAFAYGNELRIYPLPANPDTK